MKRIRQTLWGGALLALAVGMITAGCATFDGGIPSDADLEMAVRNRLEGDTITGRYNFGVTAIDGVIYLRGSAPPSSAIRARAISLAFGASPGVIEVVDDLFPPTSGVY